MIKYNLICKCKFQFDSWFLDSKEFDRQKKRKLINCPSCNSDQVKKSLMSPRLSSATKKSSLSFEKNLKKQLVNLRNYVEKNCKYVGDRFAEEARTLHYDKKTSQGIYGKATPEETEELNEEGIEVINIPWPRDKEN